MSTQPQGPPAVFTGSDIPDESELYKCVHCGFCLPSCPTYIATGLETESPRGRIALMKAVTENRIEISPRVIRHWDLCIQCRACEVACPSGVPYGSLIEATMLQANKHRNMTLLNKVLSKFSLTQLLPHQKRLAILVTLLSVYQKTGFQRALRGSRILKLLPAAVSELEASLPVISSTSFASKGQTYPAQNVMKHRVALLTGCIMPLIHGLQMESITRVLTRNGCEVVIAEGQVCCGAINSHVGDLSTARSLARRNIDVFLESGVDTVIVASAGCGSRMKEYTHLLREDPEYLRKAESLAAKVEDIHEFLVKLPLDYPKATLPYRVTYQDSCHLANAQRITEQPRQLIKSIRGVEFIELATAATCCGGGGTYAITEREFSLRILQSKIDDLKKADVDIVTTANPGCVIQLEYGIRRNKLPLKVCYVTDLLDEAYQRET